MSVTNDPIVISNARVLVPEGWVEQGSVLIEGGKITSITADGQMAKHPDAQCIDAEGLMLLPGFIDIHVHGGGGYDAMRGDPEDLYGMCRFHASHGTTSLLATTLTAPQEEIIRAITSAADVMQMEREADGAQLLGVHLEGPFLNHIRCGAQNPEDLRDPSLEEFDAYWSASRGTLKQITIAPELPGAYEVIARAVSLGVSVSLGHTDADFLTMRQASDWGASQVTHLFNGMRPLHHREPGAAGAALMLDSLAVEMICDGYHVHPELVKWVFEVKPKSKVILITDSMSAAGCPDGEYLLGKLPVRMKKGKVFLKQADGTEGSLAGSSLTMRDALANAAAFTGMKIEELIPALTMNPASQIGAADTKGSIESGKDADLILMDSQLRVRKTFVGGKLVYENHF